jgi:hypothetical protein
MRPCAVHDREDTKNRSNGRLLASVRQFPQADVGQFAKGFVVGFARPVRNLRIPALSASELDGGDNRVGVPVRRAAETVNSNEVWDSDERSLSYVPLVVKLLPERIPRRLLVPTRFETLQERTQVDRSPVTRLQSVPARGSSKLSMSVSANGPRLQPSLPRPLLRFRAATNQDPACADHTNEARHFSDEEREPIAYRVRLHQPTDQDRGGESYRNTPGKPQRRFLGC